MGKRHGSLLSRARLTAPSRPQYWGEFIAPSYTGRTIRIRRDPNRNRRRSVIGFWGSLPLRPARVHGVGEADHPNTLGLVSELNRTLLEKRSDRSRERFRIVDFHVTLELHRLTLSELITVGDMHRRHDALDALGPHPGDPIDDLAGLREYLSAVHDVVHGPQRVGFRCSDLAARQCEFNRLGAAEVMDKFECCPSRASRRREPQEPRTRRPCQPREYDTKALTPNRRPYKSRRRLP